jgi:hypothetical protein
MMVSSISSHCICEVFSFLFTLCHNHVAANPYLTAREHSSSEYGVESFSHPSNEQHHMNKLWWVMAELTLIQKHCLPQPGLRPFSHGEPHQNSIGGLWCHKVQCRSSSNWYDQVPKPRPFWIRAGCSIYDMVGCFNFFALIRTLRSKPKLIIKNFFEH